MRSKSNNLTVTHFFQGDELVKRTRTKNKRHNTNERERINKCNDIKQLHLRIYAHTRT